MCSLDSGPAMLDLPAIARKKERVVAPNYAGRSICFVPVRASLTGNCDGSVAFMARGARACHRTVRLESDASIKPNQTRPPPKCRMHTAVCASRNNRPGLPKSNQIKPDQTKSNHMGIQLTPPTAIGCASASKKTGSQGQKLGRVESVEYPGQTKSNQIKPNQTTPTPGFTPSRRPFNGAGCLNTV